MNELYKILADIKNKKFAPVYFLTGDEGFFIDKISNALLDSVLTEDEKAFNMDVFYGKETDIKQVQNIARQFPMMSDYRLVFVKEAQVISNIDDFATYLDQVQTQTIVVFNYRYKKLDKRKLLYKKLTSSASVLFTSSKLKDAALPKFLSDLVQSKKRTIGLKAQSMLLDCVGNHLNNLENEVDKICISLPEGQEITDDIIEKNVGISKDYNNFELKSAIAQRDEAKAYKIAHYFSQNQKENPLVLTSFTLYSFFSLLLEYQGATHKNKQLSIYDIAKQLKKSAFMLYDIEKAAKNYTMKATSRNISYLKDFDLKLKGVGAIQHKPFDLLAEFLAKIFQR